MLRPSGRSIKYCPKKFKIKEHNMNKKIILFIILFSLSTPLSLLAPKRKNRKKRSAKKCLTRKISRYISQISLDQEDQEEEETSFFDNGKQDRRDRYKKRKGSRKKKTYKSNKNRS